MRWEVLEITFVYVYLVSYLGFYCYILRIQNLVILYFGYFFFANLWAFVREFFGTVESVRVGGKNRRTNERT